MLPMLNYTKESLRSGGAYVYFDVDPVRVDPYGFGRPKAFPRLPRALLINCSDADEPAVQAWANALWTDTFLPRKIQVGASGSRFPFLAGMMTEGLTSTTRTDTFWTPVQTTEVIPPQFVFGGRVMVATITKYRVAWRPDLGSGDLNNLNDYVVWRTNAPDVPPTGFTEYPDPLIPLGSGIEHAGFTVFEANAALHIGMMHSVVHRFKRFKHVFYQGVEEAPSIAPDGSDSEIVPESAMNALMGGSPYLSRKPYTTLAEALGMIAEDAIAFLTEGDAT